MRLLILFLTIPTIGLSQLLTEIKTVEQAERFITTNLKFYDYRYQSFKILTGDTLNFDTFKAGDFNHDGQSDLLIFGNATVIRDKDKEPFKRDEIIIILGDKKRPKKANFPFDYFRNWFTHIRPYPSVVSKDGKDFIEIKYDVYDRRGESKETFYETVFVKNEKLIPYTDQPSTKTATRVEFKTNYCYGSCPVFELIINSNGDVEYNGLDHVDRKGLVRLKMNDKDWDYLQTLLKYLKVEDLKDNYSVNWTDDQTVFLKIYFKDGDKKEIEDYGMVGTFGLSILFDFLYKLREF